MTQMRSKSQKTESTEEPVDGILVPGMRSIRARFPNNATRYSYLVPEGDDPRVGDLILTSVNLASLEEMQSTPGLSFVVENGLRKNKEYITPDLMLIDSRMAQIVEVLSAADSKVTKFYLQLIPYKQTVERITRNREHKAEVDRRRRAYEQLRLMASKRDQMRIFSELAAEDPEAARLLRIAQGLPEYPLVTPAAPDEPQAAPQPSRPWNPEED